jgi:hypothetical protein
MGRATQPPSVAPIGEPLQRGGLLHCQLDHVPLQVHLQRT